MNKNLCLLLVFMGSLGCKPDELELKELIHKFEISTKSIPADGTSLITVSASINPDIDTDKRMVIFTTSAGSFVDGKDGKISKVAEFQNGNLIAVVQLKAPVAPTTITVTAEMAYAELRKDFVATETISATTSEPFTLQLAAEALSVLNNFEGEITLTGKVLNKDGRPASRGYEVEISDLYLNDNPVNGRFRPGSKTVTDNNSQFSVAYSPGAVPNRTDIKLKASVKNYPTATGQVILNVRETN